MTQYSLVKSPILPGLIGLFLTQQFSVSLHKPEGEGRTFVVFTNSHDNCCELLIIAF